MSDFRRTEIKLTDLLVDPAVKELSRALIALAKVEDDARAIVALLWATQVMMHANLIDVHRHGGNAAEENRAVYADMLIAAGEHIKETDTARLSELVETPVIQGPRRVQ